MGEPLDELRKIRLEKLKKLKDGVPFGPFLAVGVFVIIFYGAPLIRWYFGLI